ncbi:MAG: lamin tail domain-containing protein [Cyclobacteriaceae bacterium]
MLIRFLQLLIGLSVVTALQAQIREDFSDGDILNNPIWSGDQDHFVVNGETLQLMAPSAGISHLATSNMLFDKVVWEFYVKMDFNPSSSNLAKIYLMSDQEEIDTSLNGFYILIGETEDEISLYKQKGESSTYVINGTDDVVDVSSPEIRVKVIRDQNGRWSLYYDLSGGWNYEFAGSAIDDDPDITLTNYFGLICRYTSTRTDKFYFDDIVVDQVSIDSIMVQNDTTIHVFLNQYLLESDISDPSDFSITDLNIADIGFVGNDSSILAVDLDPASPLQTAGYQFQISSDVTLNEAKQESFGYTRLKLDTVVTLSGSEVLLDFNQGLDPVSAEDTANYLIDQEIGNPVSATVDPDDNSQVHLILNDVLTEAVEYQIDVAEVLNESLNSHLSGSVNFSFVVPLLIDSINVLSNDSLQVYFNKPLDPVTATNTSNYVLNLGMGSPKTATLGPNGTSIFLVFEQTLDENYYELMLDGIKDSEGLSIEPGSIIGFEYYRLWVFEIWQTDFETIMLQFNQPVSQSADVVEHYNIIGVGSPSDVSITMENDSIVQLTFPELHNSGYRLVIEGIENQELNTILEKDTLSFNFEKPTDWRAVQINEIMADFSPSIGLPEAEFIELHNPGNFAIDLEDFILNGEPIPQFRLEPVGYLVITDDSNFGLFEADVVYQLSFDALTNSGDFVILQDQFGNAVDSLYYTSDWYHNTEKDDGGYSLEQINTQLICSDDTNWSASISSLGGTPGAINSIAESIADITGPRIANLEVVTGDTLSITFNEPLLAGSLNMENLSSPSFEVVDIEQYSHRNYRLILDQPLESEEEYYIIVTNIEDCQGNISTADSIPFYFDETPPTVDDLVVISDHEIALIFHEPLKESVSESEENYFLTGQGTPALATLQDSALYRVQLSWDSSFVIGETYELVSASLTDTLGNKADSIFLSFTFEDEVDSAFVIAPNLIHLLFHAAPQKPIEENSFLVSKGIGNPIIIEIDSDNPKLLRLGFEKNLSANTEYVLYTHGLISSETLERLVTPAHSIMLDTRAPRIVELTIPADSQIIVKWDEKIQLSSAFSSVQYEISDLGNPTDISAIDQKSIQLFFDFPFPKEQELNLKVSGVSDLAGNKGGNINTRFFYDPLPPALYDISTTAENTLALTFSEKLDTSTVFKTENYFVGEVNPELIWIQGPDSVSILLTFLDLPMGTEEVISITGLRDQHGNLMDSSAYHYNSLYPVVSKLFFLSNSSLQIIFSKEMSETIVEKSNYLVSNINSDSVHQFSSSGVELFLSQKASQHDTLMLELSNLVDADGFPLLVNSYSVVYDSYLAEWKAIDGKTLELEFNTVFSATSADQFSLSGVEPVFTQIDGDDKSIVRLIFSDSISPNEFHTLNLKGLEDLYGRRIPDQAIPIYLDSKGPNLVTIESGFYNQVRLIFDEKLSNLAGSMNHYQMLGSPKLEGVMQLEDSIIILEFDELTDQAIYQIIIGGIVDLMGNSYSGDTVSFQYQTPYLPHEGEIIITELMVDPSPVIGLPEAEYIEIYNAGEQIIDLGSLLLSDATRQVALPTYDLSPDTYLVLSGEILSGHAIHVPGFPTLDNLSDSISLTNIYRDVIDQVVYQRDWYGDTEKDDGGYSLEIINPFSACPGSANWRASEHPEGGTPGEINSVFSLAPDSEPPFLLNHDLHGKEIILTFSEVMDSLSLVQSDYQINGLTINKIFVLATDQMKILLNTEPVLGTLYQMHVDGPEDCSGNRIEPFEISFGKGRAPVFNEIVISEIMADPDPVIGLPNSEYLEIYNTTGELLSLENVRIEDEGGSVQLAAEVLSASEYLILVPSSSVSLFSGVDKIMGLSGWRSLSNQGESLSLYHEEDLIFHVSYEDTWYSEETDGGVALEMKDVNNPCAGAINWGSSISTQGGTPGAQNSITTAIPDNFGPELLGLEIISDQEIQLHFDEQLSIEVVPGSQVHIDPGPVMVTDILMNELDRDFITLILGESLQPNIEYTVSIRELYDCLGNPVNENTHTFFLPVKADSLDVIINEVLFNPKDDGVDFVEIYNRSEKNINLKGWQLVREENSYLIFESDFLIYPGEFLALTPDKNRLIHDFPKASSARIHPMVRFPVLPNQTTKVELINEEDQTVDAFEYHENMHLTFLESVDGVSLERISYDQPTQDRNNWQSASSTAGFATPGYQNSQFIQPSVSGVLSIEPKVFVPANQGSVIAQDFTTINYQLSATGSLANVNIYNRNGQHIKSLANGATLATSGFLRWDGSTDNGSVATMGYYLIVFELYDPQGNREIIKETVVVGQ